MDPDNSLTLHLHIIVWLVRSTKLLAAWNNKIGSTYHLYARYVRTFVEIFIFYMYIYIYCLVVFLLPTRLGTFTSTFWIISSVKNRAEDRGSFTEGEGH